MHIKNIDNEISWFKEIFDTYYESIRSYVWYKTGDINLSDDIVQEVFLKVWQHRANINQATFKSFLYKIAQNIIANHYKHQKVVYNFEKNFSFNENTYDPDAELNYEELKKKFEKVLEMMPEGSREVLLMKRIENLSYSEIADRLGLSVKAVEKRMNKALRILREKLNRI